jgi:hypothetical protein
MEFSWPEKTNAVPDHLEEGRPRQVKTRTAIHPGGELGRELK